MQSHTPSAFGPSPGELMLKTFEDHGCDPRRSGDEWSLRCPAHDDQHPSLGMRVTDTGVVLLNCRAGCDTNDVLAAVGRTMRDLFPDSQWDEDKGGIVAVYPYTDAEGTLLYESVRLVPKDFRLRQPDGFGGWLWHVRRVPRVPYRLPELVRVTPGGMVFVVEGEQDADRLASLGLVATTNAMGAKWGWPAEWGAYFARLDVVVIPDNDEAGHKRARQVAECVRPHASAVRLLELPDLPSKKGADVSDWLDAGHTVDELLDMVDAITEQAPGPRIATYPPDEEQQPRNLPDEFWQSRPILAALRAWAHAQGVAAESVYAVVRARLAVLVSPVVRVDTGILTPVSLNLLTVLLGASGTYKTTAANLGPQVVDWGTRIDVFEATLGSGEGMAEAYLDPPVKGQRLRQQRMIGGLFTLDEGAVLQELKDRSGSTLMSELRKAFSGTTLGQFNADPARRRQVSEYRFGLLANMQPSVAVRLLGDHETGNPQRFTWFVTTDPSIPDLATPVPVPQLPTMTHGNKITVAASITAELRERSLAVARGAVRPDPLDSQRPACQAKEAAMLALMDGRVAVTEDDWRLAGMVMDVSDVLRRGVMAEHQAQRAAAEEARGKAEGARAAAASTEKERRLVAALADRIVTAVLKCGGIGTGKLARTVTSAKTRHRFDPALDLAVASLRVKEQGDRVVPP
jgi:hypothetical protein